MGSPAFPPLTEEQIEELRRSDRLATPPVPRLPPGAEAAARAARLSGAYAPPRVRGTPAVAPVAAPSYRAAPLTLPETTISARPDISDAAGLEIESGAAPGDPNGLQSVDFAALEQERAQIRSDMELADRIRAARGAPRKAPPAVVPTIGAAPQAAGGDAWLDELIAKPPQTPAAAPRQTLTAEGPSGGLELEDTPDARALVQQRGMQLTSPPSDDELLDPSAPTSRASPRGSPLPEMPGDSLDELIAAEGARMDREQALAEAAAAAQPLAAQQPARPSREDVLLETMTPPSRMQGIAALLGDAFLGGDRVNQVANRQQGYKNALAQARVGDIEARELADKQAADRAMVDERLRLTMRGQDLTNQRSEENRAWQRDKFAQTDDRVRELAKMVEEGRNTRTDKLVGARGAVNTGDPEHNAIIAQMEATHLARAASRFGDKKVVSLQQAQAFQANPNATAEELGVTPEQYEMLKQERAQLAGLKASKPEEYVRYISKGGTRETGTGDAVGAAIQKKRLDPVQRTKLKTELDNAKAEINNAMDSWEKLSSTAKDTVVKLGSATDPEDWKNILRQASLTGDEQAKVSDLYKKLNAIVQERAGLTATNQEVMRISAEAGMPAAGFAAVFNSPKVVTHWLNRMRESYLRRKRDVASEYDLSEGQP